MSTAIVLWQPPPRSYVVLPDGAIARPWDPSGEYIDVWPMRVPHPDAWRPHVLRQRAEVSMRIRIAIRIMLLVLTAVIMTYEWYFLVSVCCAFALRFA